MPYLKVEYVIKVDLADVETVKRELVSWYKSGGIRETDNGDPYWIVTDSVKITDD